MHFDPNALHQIASDRQQELRAEAAHRRLVASTPLRTRFAQVLRRAADRIDAATTPPRHVRNALPERG